MQFAQSRAAEHNYPVNDRCLQGCHADHVAPLSTKVGTNFATSGGRSVGIVRSRTHATEFYIYIHSPSEYETKFHTYPDDIIEDANYTDRKTAASQLS
jgi:hypothetical protein